MTNSVVYCFRTADKYELIAYQFDYILQAALFFKTTERYILHCIDNHIKFLDKYFIYKEVL